MSRDNAPTRAELNRQLDRIQHSATFADSERLMELLRFVVEEVLAGRAAALKESVIGNSVYSRDPPYDPRIDSTVRVEARRLRQKLDDYYAGEGSDDPIFISLPVGSYVPVFGTTPRERSPVGSEAEKRAEVFAAGPGAAVAVLPFRALSYIPGDQSFADGLTDEVAFALGRSKGLRITSRSSTLQFKDSGLAPSLIAKELNVDAILVGTVRRVDGIVRVTLETSDATGFVMWSDRFDVPDRDQLELQEAIATTVLSRARLDSSLMRAMKIRPSPQALSLHAKVYRARVLLDLQTPSSIHDALQLFSEVAGAAPDYARGFSGVADCYCDLHRLGVMDADAAGTDARAAVSKALEIDPQSVEANTALATIIHWFDKDSDGAEARFIRALDLGDYARAARHYGVLLTMTGRYEEAERQFRDARRIEPFSAAQDIAESISYYQSRRYHLLAEPDAQKWHTSPAPLEALVFRSLAQVFSGAEDAARVSLARIRKECARFPNLVFSAAELQALLGGAGDSSRLPSGGDVKATWFARATLSAALGDEAAVLDAVEAAIDARELSRAWFLTDPRFDKLRGSGRFVASLSRLGKPQGA